MLSALPSSFFCLVFEGCCLGKYLEHSSWLISWCFILLRIYEIIISFSFLPSGICVLCSILPISTTLFFPIPTLIFDTNLSLLRRCWYFVCLSQSLHVLSCSPSFVHDASPSPQPPRPAPRLWLPSFSLLFYGQPSFTYFFSLLIIFFLLIECMGQPKATCLVGKIGNLGSP